MLIFGLGQSGKAVAEYCSENGIESLIVDDAPEAARRWLSDHEISFPVMTSQECAADISNYVQQTFVVAPGVPPSHPLMQLLRNRNVNVINELELAFQMHSTRMPNIIAVTGTNGKTTVVELVTHILQHAGLSALAIGNIGVPVLEAFRVSPWPDWFVMEVSSFQLELMQQRGISLGCWLNLTPNHLDWHTTMEEYRKAKARIISLMAPGGCCLIHESIDISPLHNDVQLLKYGRSKENELFFEEGKLFFRGDTCGDFPEALLNAPLHDKENYMAAFALSRLAGVLPETIRESYATFKKPSHRIEFVEDLGGIQFWDDSKGTNIAATIAAVRSVPGPIVLIAGGVHKGASYSPWKESFLGKVKAIFAIGEAKNLIAQDIGDVIPVKCVDRLEDAIKSAAAFLSPPFSVLLSPGCSSYDMFCNYKERGRRFQEAVRKLEGVPCR